MRKGPVFILSCKGYVFVSTPSWYLPLSARIGGLGRLHEIRERSLALCALPSAVSLFWAEIETCRVEAVSRCRWSARDQRPGCLAEPLRAAGVAGRFFV